jgi:hypothetical protein
MKQLLAFVACFVFGASVATAQTMQKYATTISEQPDSPVNIERCFVWNYNGLREQVEFRNATDDKTVIAVRFYFMASDAFGDAMTPIASADATNTVAPGVLISRYANHWVDPLNPWTDPKSVTCSVDKVRFADGTVWKAGAAPSASRSPSASPSESPSPSPSPAASSQSNAFVCRDHFPAADCAAGPIPAPTPTPRGNP